MYDAYNYIFLAKASDITPYWFSKIWAWNISLKLVCFGQLVWKNKILTWDNLCKRGLFGLGRCVMCKNELENVRYLFLICLFAIYIWNGVMKILNISAQWKSNSIENCLVEWTLKYKVYHSLPFYIFSQIWRSRNSYIFEAFFVDIH